MLATFNWAPVERLAYDLLDCWQTGRQVFLVGSAGGLHGQGRPGLDLATRYDCPDHLKGKPRYHVRIHWKDAVGGSVNLCGPVVIGAGRYCGLGLFAGDN